MPALDQAVRIDGHTAVPAPDRVWVRGTCPCCGLELVSRCYYVSGRGYLVVWECWGSRQEEPNCDYRRVL